MSPGLLQENQKHLSLNSSDRDDYIINEKNFNDITNSNKSSSENIKLLEKFDSLTNIIEECPNLDEIINESGFSCPVYIVIIMTIMRLFMYGFYEMSGNIILEPFKNYFKITQFQVEFIFSLKYIGFIIGSFLCGYISKLVKRTTIIYLNFISILFCHIIQ